MARARIYAALTALTLAPVALVPSAAAASSGEVGPAEGGTISGTVTSSWCNPIGSLVTPLAWDSDLGTWVPGDSTFSDPDDGHYELTGLPAGDYVVQFGMGPSKMQFSPWVVEYSGDVVRVDDAAPVTVGAGQVVDVDARLEHGGEVRGHVVSEDGWALVFVDVTAYRRRDTGGGPVWERVRARQTGVDGQYHLGQLPAGSYRLEFDGGEGLGAPTVQRELDVEHGYETTGVDVVLGVPVFTPPYDDWARPPVQDVPDEPTLIPADRTDSCESGPTPEPTPEPEPEDPAVTFDRTPKLVGKARVGKRLRVVHRKVTPRTAEVRYRWFAGTERIRRARGPRLRLTRAMLGRRISVKVVARAPGHTKAVVRLRASAVRRLPR